MNVRGFELTQTAQSRICSNAYCSAIIPLCFAGISPNCARNRSLSDWHHFSFGEHVCSACFAFLDYWSQQQKAPTTVSVWRHRLNTWRREWEKRSSPFGRHIPTGLQFLAAQFLPWWVQCIRCGSWRQLAPHTPIGSPSSPYRPGAFSCAEVTKSKDDPCSWPLDERTVLVRSRPQDFLASMLTHAWLQGSPGFEFFASYGIDLVGLSPDPLPGAALGDESTDEILSKWERARDGQFITWARNMKALTVGVSPDGGLMTVLTNGWRCCLRCQGIMISSLMKRDWQQNPPHLAAWVVVDNGGDDTGEPTSFKPFDSHGPFSVVDLRSWERLAFPEMTRFPALYLGIRNLIICLWFQNPKRYLTAQFVADRCFIRGLLRIVVCEHWIPRLVEELTCRGLINLTECRPSAAIQSTDAGILQLEPPTVPSGTSQECIVQFVGKPDLTNAVAARQIFNGLRARQRPIFKYTQRNDPNSSFRFNYRPVAEASPQPEKPDDFSNPFSEICVCFGQISHGDNEANDQSQSSRCFESLPCVELLSKDSDITCVSNDGTQLSLDRLILPRHAWSDRVYMHSNHPLAILAHQADLLLRPLNQCSLLCSSPENEQAGACPNRLCSIPPDLSVRIEFHVEAVLDMVAQQPDCDSPSNDLNLDGKEFEDRSVQAHWDLLDFDVRSRLSDLTSSKMEKKLVEFYLAAVEYDLTEPLTTNVSNPILRSSCSTAQYCATARLDQIPAPLYAEFIVDDQNLVIQSTDDEPSSWKPFVISVPVDAQNKTGSDMGIFTRLNDTLLSGLRIADSVTSEREQCCTGLTILRDLLSFLIEGETVQADSVSRIASTPHSIGNKTDVNFEPNSDDVEVGEQQKIGQEKDDARNIILHTASGGTEVVDWVVLSYPSNQIRLVFTEEPAESEHTSDPQCNPEGSIFSIYLPLSLRPFIVCENEKDGPPESELPWDSQVIVDVSNPNSVSPALLITVTLVYSHAWWRSKLTAVITPPDASHTESGSKSPQSFDVFAILPDTREDRGFCHIFRDMQPELRSPGVLQTQIFAAAAGHWWPREDADLAAAVDRHLCSHLSAPESSSVEEPPDFHLLGYHIARLQTSSKRPSFSDPSHVSALDANGQPISLHPGAWGELARRGHVIVPSFIAEPLDSPDFTISGAFKPASFNSSAVARSMDPLTSAFTSGLKIADVALRWLPGFDSNRPSNDHFYYSSTSIVDSTVCAEEFNDANRDESHLWEDSSEMSPFCSASKTTGISDRARRLLKRKHVEPDLDDCLTPCR